MKIKFLQHRELKMMLTSIKPNHLRSTVHRTTYYMTRIKKIPDLGPTGPDRPPNGSIPFLSFTALALALVDFYSIIDIYSNRLITSLLFSAGDSDNHREGKSVRFQTCHQCITFDSWQFFDDGQSAGTIFHQCTWCSTRLHFQRRNTERWNLGWEGMSGHHLSGTSLFRVVHVVPDQLFYLQTMLIRRDLPWNDDKRSLCT